MNTLLGIVILCLNIDLIVSTTTEINSDADQYLEDKNGRVCTTPGCVRAAATVLNNIDESVEPCEDFYKFACGKYLKETIIPDDRSYASYVYVIADKIVEQMKVTFENPPAPNELKPFVISRKYYNLCMNTSAIESDGLNPMKAILQKLGGWPVLEGLSWDAHKFDWKNRMQDFRKLGLPINGFLNVFVGRNVRNASQLIINIDQAVLGLQREYLTKGLDNQIVKAYYDYLVDIAVSFGADKERALIEMKETVEFETELAQISLSREERRNISLMTNIMTVTELHEKFPSIPWLEYINSIIEVSNVTIGPNDTIDLGVPKFITKLEQLLNGTSKRIQANYFMNQAVTAQLTYLTMELRERKLKYTENLDGVKRSEPRWMECVRLTGTSMAIASAAEYARNYFNEESKKTATELVTNLKNSFLETLKQVDWMDETTRQKAIEKANAMYPHVAYPQELLDDSKLEEFYTDLNPTSDNFLELHLSIEKFNRDLHFKKLLSASNKTDWTVHSNILVVNAYNDLVENSIRITAGIMQGVFFDNERPHYMNYGSMGFVIGHEITHGFDDLGRQFDVNGELAEWWEPKTKETFLEKAQCIIDQYGNYTAPEVQLNLNGINTQGENIADVGGLKEAYRAYVAWVERNGEEARLPGLNYTPKQMFWISAANFWCEKDRDQYLRRTILTDPHAPSYFRVFGAFSNSEYFPKDFNCIEGSKMNPKHKCNVW